MRPAAIARRQLEAGDVVVDRLDELVDWRRLGRLGWDPTREVFAPAADDVVFGFVECATAGCERIAAACGCTIIRAGHRRCTQRLWAEDFGRARFQTPSPGGGRRIHTERSRANSTASARIADQSSGGGVGTRSPST